MKRTSGLCVVVLLAATMLCLAPSRAEAADPGFSVQGGWWSLEADLQTRSGLFIDAGVPLAGIFLAETTGGTSWFVPLEFKLGYQHALSERFRLRLGARSAFMASGEDPCGTGCHETAFRSFNNLEVGFRYETPTGFVAGVELPVFTLQFKERSVEPWWPGPSLAFSELYVGYRWSL